MHQLLLAYSSSEGQTLKIVQFIAQIVQDRGYSVDVAEVSTLTGVHLEKAYDAAILGASIHAGRHQRSMVRFAREHRNWLDGLSTAFFSVSLTSATKDHEHRTRADEYVNEFISEVGWVPDRIWYVAGALAYRKYSILKRLLVRQVVKREGGDIDTSRNHEYTDWDELRASVVEFLNNVLEPHYTGTGTI